MKPTTLKTIEIIVSPNGSTTVETKGFAGESCQDASRFLEETLGVRASEQHTAEFYQAAESRLEQTLEQRGG